VQRAVVESEIGHQANSLAVLGLLLLGAGAGAACVTGFGVGVSGPFVPQAHSVMVLSKATSMVS
jgi:hypothetical protein